MSNNKNPTLSSISEVSSSTGQTPGDAGQTPGGAWAAKAACRSVPNASDVFFSDETVDLAAAKLICSTCPVVAPCLQGALTRREAAGVWGGQLFCKGQIITVKRRRGRPPKVARVEDELPEVPIPAHLQKLIA